LATAVRALPTFFAISSWVSWNCSAELRAPQRLLDRIQVLALEILDEREFEDFAVGGRSARPRELRSTPAS
jgi:hypothetical protein